MNLRIRILTAACALAVTIGMIGCNTWERTTFQTLSASKAVIDQAQADYEAGTITKTAQAFALINSAKKAQTAAVDAMVAYETIKASGGTSSALSTQQQVVVAALAVIPQLIVEIKALYGTKQSVMIRQDDYRRAA